MASREPQIRTPDQRLRVFISSTIKELADERAAVSAAVTSMKMHPILFELGARPHPPRDLYRSYVDQSDIFVGIYWESYGWVAPGMEISGIEDEFVLSHDLPRLIYVKEPADNRDPHLRRLLDRISEAGVSYRKFSDPQELSDLVQDDLAVLITERFSGKEEPQHLGLKTRIPAPYTDLVGREREVEEITKRFLEDGVRLVSLTGPGGVGKSRLAIELALRMKNKLADGAHFVMLEFTGKPEQVPSDIAASLELHDWMSASDPIASVTRALKDKEMLLVLDNFEQVLDASEYLTSLMFACPRIRILVTSRTLLRLRAERNYPLQAFDPPTDGDDTTNDAMKMFMARSRRDYSDDPLQRDAVAEICRRVDGLPLGLELAAARTNLLSPIQIAERLDDHLKLLKGASSDLPERHKTIEDAIGWSHDLLCEEDRIFFRRLAVFDGGFTLDDAAAVCDPDGELDALERMQSLIENSLVLPVDEGLDPRFGMFKSIRAFACNRFEVSSDYHPIRRNHADHFLQLIVKTGEDLRSHRQFAALDVIESDEDNIHKALAELIEAGRISEATSIAWAIWPYWWIRGRAWLGRECAEDLLGSCPEEEFSCMARTRAISGAMSLFAGKHGEAVAALAQAADELEKLEDAEALGLTKCALGLVSSVVLPERTMPLMTEAVDSLKRAREWYGYAIAMNSLCLMDLVMDLNNEPEQTFRSAVEACERIGSRLELAVAQGNLAAKLHPTDPAESIALLRKAINTLAEGQMNSGLAFMADFLGEMVMHDGDDETAMRFFGFSDALFAAIDAIEAPSTRKRRERLMAEAKERLGEAAAEDAHRKGASYSFLEGVEEALSLCDRLAPAAEESRDLHIAGEPLRA